MPEQAEKPLPEGRRAFFPQNLNLSLCTAALSPPLCCFLLPLYRVWESKRLPNFTALWTLPSQ
jgi:hypothetical protein